MNISGRSCASSPRGRAISVSSRDITETSGSISSCIRPDPVRRLVDELALALSRHTVDVVCGPLVEGAFVALMAASALDVPFTYSERKADRAGDGLFPARYAIPRALRPQLKGRRVAVVNDDVNAGSAVRGTLADVKEHGGVPVVIGTLNDIWVPAECPLGARQIPLIDPASAEP